MWKVEGCVSSVIYTDVSYCVYLQCCSGTVVLMCAQVSAGHYHRSEVLCWLQKTAHRQGLLISLSSSIPNQQEIGTLSDLLDKGHFCAQKSTYMFAWFTNRAPYTKTIKQVIIFVGPFTMQVSYLLTSYKNATLSRLLVAYLNRMMHLQCFYINPLDFPSKAPCHLP